MKKIVKKLLVASACALLVFAAAACGKGDDAEYSATSYGVVHTNYVGEATVVVRGGKIKSVEIREVQLPYDWAKISAVDADSTEIAEEDQVVNEAYDGASTKAKYANKIRIGDVVFTARDSASANNYVDYFNADKNGNTPFMDWLKTGSNAKWVFEKMVAGEYDFVKADATDYSAVFKAASVGTLSKGDRFLKNKNGYWPESSDRLGWLKNVSAIENYVVDNGVADYKAAKATLVVSGEEEIKVNGISTGATMKDFKDYMDIIVAAEADATAQYDAAKE